MMDGDDDDKDGWMATMLMKHHCCSISRLYIMVDGKVTGISTMVTRIIMIG